MCDANAYLKKGGEEELILSEVTSASLTETGWKVASLFGEEVEVKGKLTEVNIMKRRIVFEADG